MKKFTQLALAASVALSANAMAMQAMDDSSLSATTGQDGISIGIGISKITIDKVFIHDNDGLALKGTAAVAASGSTAAVPASADYNGGTSTAGAIYIKGNGVDDKVTKDANGNDVTTVNEVKNKGIFIGANYDNSGAYLLASRNLADLKIDSDAGNGNPFINIAANVSGLDIRIGEIGVVASGSKTPATGATSVLRRGGTGTENAILSGLSLKTGQMTANIQLGAAPQGAMIKLNTTMIGGLEILELGILDKSTNGKAVGIGATGAITTTAAGEIFIESIKIADANLKDLTLNQTVSVYGSNGLAETTGKSKGYVEILSTSGAHDLYVKGIHLGSKSAASIGDVEVQGMQTYYSPLPNQYAQGAKITISGH